MKKTLLLLMLILLAMPACSGRRTQKAHVEAQKVAQDSRRVSRIPDKATPRMVRAAMGREPDDIRHVDNRLIYYYLIKGAVRGEALRLVFQDGVLIGRSIVQTGQGY